MNPAITKIESTYRTHQPSYDYSNVPAVTCSDQTSLSSQPFPSFYCQPKKAKVIIADSFEPCDETLPNIETGGTMTKHSQHSSHSPSRLFQISEPNLNAAAAAIIDGSQPVPASHTTDSPITRMNSIATKLVGVAAADLQRILIHIITNFIHITDRNNVWTKTRTWDLFFSSIFNILSKTVEIRGMLPGDCYHILLFRLWTLDCAER